MDTKMRRLMLRPIVGKPKGLTDQAALVRALDELEHRAIGERLLGELRPRLEKAREKQEQGSWRDPESAKEAVTVATILYASRRLSTSQYVYHACAPVGYVYDERLLNGEYESDLEAVERGIRDVKTAHGLTEDEDWLLDEGPEEWKKLNKQWEVIVDNKFIDTLREFGLDWIADLKDKDARRFKRLHERGRRSVFHTEDTEHILRDIVKRYEKDAVRAASAKAYASAITSLGTAVEGLLTLRCLRSPKKARRLADALTKRRRQGSDPTKWSFDTLIEVCLQGGWLPPFETDAVVYDSAGLAHLLRRMRNYVHPSMQAVERPWVEIDERDYRDAKAIYAVLYQALVKNSRKHRAEVP